MAKIKCPKCGTELEAGSRFCTSCGTRLTPAQSSGSADPSRVPAEDIRAKAAAAGAALTTAVSAQNEPAKRSDRISAAASEETAPYSAAGRYTAPSGSAADAAPAEPYSSGIAQDGSVNSFPADQPQRDKAASSDLGENRYETPISPYLSQSQPVVKKTARKKSSYSREKIRKQTVPERMLNLIGSILLCVLIAAAAYSSLALEFINQATTREAVEIMVKNVDLSQIKIAGKSLPETIINGFGLDYDTLGLIGIDEAKINASFSDVTSLASGRLGLVAESIREGGDTESIVLASKEEIMNIIRGNDTIVKSLPIPDLSDTIYDIIDKGLTEAGFGGGLTVASVIDSMDHARAEEVRSYIQTAHTGIKAVNALKYVFACACLLMIAVMFILNKRRARASFFWLAVDSGFIACGMLFIHFAWVTFRSLIHGDTSVLLQAVQPVAIDYTLRYGIIFAAGFVILLALSAACILVSARRRSENR